MLRILLFVLLLSSCLHPAIIPLDTNWDPTPAAELDGIVAIATGWGKAHLCTGVLIHPTQVLTAAHCLHFPPEDLQVVFDCSDIRSEGCQRRDVVSIEIHPLNKMNYVSSDDLGIITIDPILNIKPAIIHNSPSVEPGLSIMLAGFGRRGDRSGRLFSGMGRVDTDYTYEFIAGRRGWQDPHPGDSGGPAYIMVDGEMRLIGILSRAITKGESYTGFAIYTKPKLYEDWILENLNVF